MPTTTFTHTRTKTAVYLAEVVMGSIADILNELRIDVTALFRDWAQDESAIKAWIDEGSLEMAILECHQPNGTVAPIVEFPIAYQAGGTGDARFTAARAALARYRAKLDRVPPGTRFAIICSFNGPRSDQPGWGPTTRASTSGMRSLQFGTLASAPGASVSMRYLR